MLSQNHFSEPNPPTCFDFSSSNCNLQGYILRTIGVALNFFIKLQCFCDPWFAHLSIYEARCVHDNLPNVNKTTHPTKGVKKVQDVWTRVHVKRRNHQLGCITQGVYEQIKDSNLPLQGAYHRRRGEML
jgi:hypothetical protein